MMGVNAVYESNVLRPREELGLKKGEVVEIEIIKDSIDRLSAPVRISRQDWIEELIEDQTRITAAKIKMFDLLHYIIILTNLL
ncbi:antitoxin family protein [Methanothrix sp.]|jgi:predicted DNA-binding antitoxin AbrB/MazE fold protein|uniref:antitoxin family protein n=1 Tax=Methanothrix sp. TaxID=90426 RepID=UPI0034515A8F